MLIELEIEKPQISKTSNLSPQDDCTEETVHASLLKAISQDPRQVQEASQQLQILSTQQSYYRVLAHLFPLENVHYDLRLLCLTQLKEFVIR